VRIEECSSLEQCVMVGGDSGVATCINPCLDSLGQDTSNGCEFYPLEVDVTPTAAGACFAVYIVNQWKSGEPARIQVDRGGTVLPVETFARIPTGTGTNITYAPYSTQAGLAKDQVAILFLSRDPAALNDQNPIDPRVLASCPPGITPAVVGDAATHGTGRGTAFHVKTNVPVVAYQIFPYGGGRARITAATLLLPTNVWDTNYVAVNSYPLPTVTAGDGNGLTLAIIGQADGTTVNIRPTADITAGGGLVAATANVTQSYTVNKGEYLQFTQVAELTGSAIKSDKPVAVIGGSTLMDVPLGRDRADHAEQMLPPVKTLGSEYVAVRYRSRGTDPDSGTGEESVPWRIVGVVDGTSLSYSPAAPPGAPSILNARQVIEFWSPNPFIVWSQDASHPFYLAAYMTGGRPFPAWDDAGGEGDAEFVNVVSPAQYLSHYTFFTDPTYPETNLVVIRKRDPVTSLFPDITLDCAGTLTGWTPISDTRNALAWPYEYTRIDLSSGDFQGQNGCNNGVHTMSGSFTSLDSGDVIPSFGLTVWGFGNTTTWPPDQNQTVDEANPKQTRGVS
jgi:hypothetical protein